MECIFNCSWQLASPFTGRRDELPFAWEEIRLSAEAKAQRIIQEELQALGWDLEERKRPRKGDPEKVRVAKRLRQETTMTLAWIAPSLHTGAAGHVSGLRYRKDREDNDCGETS
jgi:hypothetical protein